MTLFGLQITMVRPTYNYHTTPLIVGAVAGSSDCLTSNVLPMKKSREGPPPFHHAATQGIRDYATLVMSPDRTAQRTTAAQSLLL